MAPSSTQLSQCTATKYRIVLRKDSVNHNLQKSLEILKNANSKIVKELDDNILPNIQSDKRLVKEINSLVGDMNTSSEAASLKIQTFGTAMDSFNCTSNPDKAVENFTKAINSLIEQFNVYKTSVITVTFFMKPRF